MINFHPQVSIIIPVYNGSNYLQCAIDSALGQDYDNIEVIVVNDGSTDNTKEIAKNYGNKIRYFSKENGGVATALNMAIKNAGGEYISWLSHDDYYLPNKLSRQIEELEKIIERKNIIIFSDAKIVYVPENKTNGNTKYIKNQYPCLLTKNESLKALLSWDIHGCSLLVPKLVFETAGYFDENLFITQDYYLWFKFIKAGYQFYCLNEELLVVRNHEEQGTNKEWNIARYEQLKLWKYVKKTFRKELSEDKELAVLSEEKILMFNNSIKKDNIYNIIVKILKKIIPNKVYQYLKMKYRKGKMFT
jgi:glycosyltransferase involved in cell wall biosynthesis